MAISATVKTLFGEERNLYIRLNNLESSNHGAESLAKFRGFLSKEAFQAGSHFMWEFDLIFTADVTQSLWNQAYEKLKEAGITGPWLDE